MRCGVCYTQNVFEKEHLQTLVHHDRFVDEKGRTHLHDSNIHEIKYECINGHSWTHFSYARCWCGWVHGVEVVND